MATYIVLCTFDKAGIEGLLKPDGDVAKKAEKLMQEVGGEVEKLWLTTGPFDLVAVVDAPDTRKALAFLLAFSSLGNVSTQTLTAEEGVGQVLSDAQSAKTNIGGAPQ